MTIRVVVADDHRVVREGLCYLLGQEPDVEVAGEAGDGRQTVDVVAATCPDVLLLDLYMPGLDGHAVIAALHDTPHRPAVVVLTSATDDEHLIRAMRAGATSYLLKTAPAEHVIAAIRDDDAGTASRSGRSSQPRRGLYCEGLTNIFLCGAVTSGTSGIVTERGAVWPKRGCCSPRPGWNARAGALTAGIQPGGRPGQPAGAGYLGREKGERR